MKELIKMIIMLAMLLCTVSAGLKGYNLLMYISAVLTIISIFSFLNEFKED